MSADAARIRELMLANLFAVFSEHDPKRRLEVIERNYTEDVTGTGVAQQSPAVSGIDVALVRDGRIAVLHTRLTRTS